jgi:hypothetical protein
VRLPRGLMFGENALNRGQHIDPVLVSCFHNFDPVGATVRQYGMKPHPASREA